jgi:hypothetical protein
MGGYLVVRLAGGGRSIEPAQLDHDAFQTPVVFVVGELALLFAKSLRGELRESRVSFEPAALFWNLGRQGLHEPDRREPSQPLATSRARRLLAQSIDPFGHLLGKSAYQILNGFDHADLAPDREGFPLLRRDRSEEGIRWRFMMTSAR